MLIDGGFIMIVKIKGQIYALSTYWSSDRQPDGSKNYENDGHSLYKLTSSEAELVCDEEVLNERPD